LIGLLTVKPQLGILFPFMLMASGRWRVFIAAAATALALVGATAAIFRTQSMDRFHIQGPARPGSRTCRSESDRDVLSHRLYEFARARPRLCRRHVGPLAYDLLPLTFAAVALLVGAGCDASGRRLVQLAYWTPALQLALGTYHLPGPALIAPAFVVYLVNRLRVSPGTGPGVQGGHDLSKVGVFVG
jgi:hypothetical protein